MVNNKTKKIWENIMALSINEGLNNNLFALDHTSFTNKENIIYDFMRDNITFHVNVYDIDNEEIAFEIYVNWNNYGKYKIYANNILNTYDIYAHGWLERKSDFYLMDFFTNSIGRNRNSNIMKIIENWNVSPMGYGIRGKFIV